MPSLPVTLSLKSSVLAPLEPDDVFCVQFVPKGYVRVTFKSLEARQAAL